MQSDHEHAKKVSIKLQDLQKNTSKLAKFKICTPKPDSISFHVYFGDTLNGFSISGIDHSKNIYAEVCLVKNGELYYDGVYQDGYKVANINELVGELEKFENEILPTMN